MTLFVSFGSTARIRRPFTWLASGDAVPSTRAAGMPRRTVKWNVLPLPSTLSADIRPPIIPTSRDEIARPSPVPPYLRVVELSTWEKAWKIFARDSLGMPTPVSRTEKWRTTSLSPRARRSTWSTTSPRLRELDRVPHEVDDDLSQSARIADDLLGHIGKHPRRQLQALLVGADTQRRRRPPRCRGAGTARPRPPASPTRSSRSRGCR